MKAEKRQKILALYKVYKDDKNLDFPTMIKLIRFGAKCRYRHVMIVVGEERRKAARRQVSDRKTAKNL